MGKANSTTIVVDQLGKSIVANQEIRRMNAWTRLAYCLAVVPAFFVSSSLSAAAQTPGPASIQGMVLDVRTGAPIPGARVGLIGPMGAGASETAEVAADGAGNYTFSEVEPGEYRLVPQREGYLDAADGVVNRVSGRILVGSGQNLQDVTLLMGPGGAIAGTVQDVERQAVADAPVSVYRYVYDTIDYRWTWTAIESVTTSGGGDFRVDGLDPGRYVVRVTPPSNIGLNEPLARLVDGVDFETLPAEARAAITNRVTGRQRAGGHLPIYYPNTSDLRQAARIDVDYARETYIRIVMPLESAFSIRGAVVDPSALDRRPTFFSLSSRDIALTRSGNVAADGTFEFSNLAPGTYDINTILSTGEPARMTPSPVPGRPPLPVPVQPNRDPDRLVDHAQVTIVNEDVDEVVIVPDAVEVSGTVETADGAPLPDGLFLAIRGPGLSTNQPHPVELGEDGRFVITHVPEGGYRLVVTGLSGGLPAGLPAGWYVESARMGAIDALDAEFRIDRSWAGQPLEVVLRRSSSDLSVTVDEVTGTQGAVFVAAVPDTRRRHRPYLYRTGWTDEDGSLRFDAMAPGEYRVFAWERVAANAWLDPEYIAGIEGRGQLVRVGESGRATVEVRVTR